MHTKSLKRRIVSEYLMINQHTKHNASVYSIVCPLLNTSTHTLTELVCERQLGATVV